MDFHMKLRSRDKPVSKPLNSTTTNKKDSILVKRKSQTPQKQRIMKKKTKNRNSRGGLFLNEELEMEILSRVPVKSLMRFKCVCKRWDRLIRENSWFKELHLSRSKKRSSLLVVLQEVETYKRRKSFKLERFLTAGLSVECKVRPTSMMHTLSRKESDVMVFDDMIGPVNGLFGLVQNSISLVTIYNFSTREVVQRCSRPTSLMKLKRKRGFSAAHEFQTYFFGFDSTTKKYKVICIWRVFENLPNRLVQERAACEVLTLGCSHIWKTVNVVIPSCCFEQVSLYAHNSIYWRSSSDELANIDASINQVLVAFDLGSEKFRVIPVPKFVPPRHCSCEFFSHDGGFRKFYPVLLEVYGQVVIYYRSDFDVIDLYLLEEDCVKRENTKWTEESIELPMVLRYADIELYPLPGSDNLLIVCYFGHTTVKTKSLYFYYRKTKTFKMVRFDEWGSNFHPYMYSTFAECLSPFRT